MKVVLDSGAIFPTRAHATDAGLDLYAREGQTVPAGGSAVFDTGVHIELPVLKVVFSYRNGNMVREILTAGFLKSKSGLNVNHDITSDGVVDVGYTGSIKVKLYNNGTKDYYVHAGDKISQLVIVPVLTPELERVDSLEDTERGDNGFGSTGK